MSESELPPLCTSIEPVHKEAMCQRDAGHSMPHRTAYRVNGGTVTAEWHEPGMIREMFKKMGRHL